MIKDLQYILKFLYNQTLKYVKLSNQYNVQLDCWTYKSQWIDEIMEFGEIIHDWTLFQDTDTVS